MKTCYNCDVELTDGNKSKEHLLQSALGGKKTSSNLLCDDCNNEFGNTIDAEIYSQIGLYADILGVNNSTRKKLITAYTEDGEEWKVLSGLKGAFIIDCDIGGNQFQIKAKSEEEAFKKIRGVLTKLKRKQPDLDVEKEMKNLKFGDKVAPGKLYFSNGRSDNPREVAVGGKGFSLALLKTMINFYLANGGSKEHINDVITFLKNESDNRPKIIRALYNDKLVRELGDEEIAHVIHIWSNQDEKYLLGYIELFGIYRYLIFLNPLYDGPEFSFTWAFDLITKEEFEPIIDFSATQQEVLNMQFNLDKATEGMDKLQGRFFKIVEDNQELL